MDRKLRMVSPSTSSDNATGSDSTTANASGSAIVLLAAVSHAQSLLGAITVSALSVTPIEQRKVAEKLRNFSGDLNTLLSSLSRSRTFPASRSDTSHPSGYGFGV